MQARRCAELLPAIFAFGWAGACQAQSNSSTGAGNIAVVAQAFWETKEFWTTTLILFFGLIIVAIEYLLLRNRPHDKVEEFSKFLVVTIIIIGTLVLLGSGVDNNAIAPAVGLFGTIAGYLLGRSDRAAGTGAVAERDTKPD